MILVPIFFSKRKIIIIYVKLNLSIIVYIAIQAPLTKGEYCFFLYVYFSRENSVEHDIRGDQV